MSLRSPTAPRALVLRAAALGFAVALAAAACGSGTPTATPGPSGDLGSEPTAAPSPTSAGSPAPSVDTSGPLVALAATPTSPVVTRELTGIDEQYINPGAVIDDGGTLHMFANVFTAWPGPVEVAHLRSTDGRTWEAASGTPVLSSDDVPLANPGIDVSTGFIAPDGTWVLVFQTVSAGSPWVIGRVTAPGPDGPWTVDPDPILEPGPAGAWDAGGLEWPSVVATEDGFAMYYHGTARLRGLGAIGRATSPDGVTWTKDPVPVLEPALDWERRDLDRPRVARTPDGFVMVYAGGRLTERGIAWSDDGVTWTRAGDRPRLTAAEFPVGGQAWDAAVLVRDGVLEYFLEIGSTGADGTQVYRFVADLP